MTVKELMEQLKAFPPDSHVVVLGYESGYDDITMVKQIAIEPVENPAWYNGRYDDTPAGKADTAEQAVLVYGRNREE